ncbi:MAG TPA: hypothetical protein V6D19_16605 [Stenomitos sp.]
MSHSVQTLLRLNSAFNLIRTIEVAPTDNQPDPLDDYLFVVSAALVRRLLRRYQDSTLRLYWLAALCELSHTRRPGLTPQQVIDVLVADLPQEYRQTFDQEGIKAGILRDFYELHPFEAACLQSMIRDAYDPDLSIPFNFKTFAASLQVCLREPCEVV